MSNFFDKFTGKKQGNNKKNKNPFTNVGKATGGGHRKFQGAGQSLGGSQPGRVFQISLPEPGPLGMRIEKRQNGEASAIVSMVVAGSQAERAGLQRGDILCYRGSNGELEINYNQFLQLAQSTDRPLVLDIRRIETKATTAGKGSADAESRRQAVIAAAEARERAHKAKEKPIPKVRKQPSSGVREVQNDFSDVPMSEEARRAVQAAKSGENQLAAQLGYNPYETNKVTAGQARNATVTTKHGSVQGGHSGAVIPPVAPPKDLPVANDDTPPVSLAFSDAFETLVTSNGAPKNSLSIMRKLMVNATTKGQTDEKFRKVRLTNAKISAAITDVHGALDCLMAVGFQLTELEDGEPYLVYPPGDKGPAWLPKALRQMERYETS